LCTLHHTAGPPVFWRQCPDTLHIYSSWMPQRPPTISDTEKHGTTV